MMEKGNFIKLAPLYYAIAICRYFRSISNIAYRGQIEAHYEVDGRFEVPDMRYLEKRALFDQAVVWLVERGIIDHLDDEFAPSVLSGSTGMPAQYELVSRDKSLPFFKYHAVNEDLHWLQTALANVNEKYDELEISEEDFVTVEDDWEPLPLDRENDEHLKKAIEAVDEIIAQVRGDNGYAANYPEERDYTLSALGTLSTRLKTATSTSIPYIKRFALDPLAVLLVRFKDAAIGVAAQGAKDAIIAFLKEHGKAILDQLFK